MTTLLWLVLDGRGCQRWAVLVGRLSCGERNDHANLTSVGADSAGSV